MKLCLQIGVMRAGKLVDDRYVQEAGEITFGRTADNTFGLLGDGLPDSRLLFHFEGHQPVLHVSEGMRGELALDGKSKTSLDQLRSKGTAGKGDWTITLPETARGWVSLGGVTFFLRQAVRPPPPPKRTLPKEARTGMLSGMETVFLAVFISVMSVEGMGVFAINRRPYIEADAPMSREDIDRFVTVEQKEEEKPKPKEDDDAKKKAEEEARRKAEEARKKAEEEANKKKDKPSPEEAAAAKAAHDEQVKEAAHKAVEELLGSEGQGGALDQVISGDSSQIASIDEAMAHANGVATVDDGLAHRSGGGDDHTMQIGDLSGQIGAGRHGNPNATKLAEKKVAPAPIVGIDTDIVDVPPTNFSSAELVRAIKGRMGSVKACYDKELKLDPSLKGKISMRFSITPQGRVGDCSVEQDTMHNENVADCIMRVIRTWSFSFKPDEEVSVAFPFVFTQSGG